MRSISRKHPEGGGGERERERERERAERYNTIATAWRMGYIPSYTIYEI